MTAGSSRSSMPDADSNPFEAALDRGSPSLPALPPRPAMPPTPLRDAGRYGPPPPLRAPLPRSAPPPIEPPAPARSQPNWSAPPEPIPATVPPGRSRSRARRRRSPQQPAIPWPQLLRRLQQILRRLERILRGRILIGLFVFWALFWLIGGIAAVRLLNMDRPTPVAQLQLPGYSNSTPSPPTPISQARDFQQQSPNGNAATSAPSNFGNLQPMVKPSRSGPPIGTFAAVVVICGLGAWFRLQHLNRR